MITTYVKRTQKDYSMSLKQPKYLLEKIDIIPDLVKEECLFETFDECIDWIKNNLTH